MIFDDLRDLASNLFAATFFLVFLVFLPIAGLLALDYAISAEKTVNTINAQCGTSYKKIDYLIVGTETMLQLCETRQKRVEIAQ